MFNVEEKRSGISKWIIAVALAAIVALILPLLTLFTNMFDVNLTSAEMVKQSHRCWDHIVSENSVATVIGDSPRAMGNVVMKYKIIRDFSEYDEFVATLQNLPDSYCAQEICELFLDSGEYDTAFFRKHDLILLEHRSYDFTTLKKIYRNNGDLHIGFDYNTNQLESMNFFVIPISKSVSKHVDTLVIDYCS